MQFSANHVYRIKFAAAILLAAVLMFSATPRARAQEVAVAEVDGRVTDPSGALVAGATVRMGCTSDLGDGITRQPGRSDAPRSPQSVR